MKGAEDQGWNALLYEDETKVELEIKDKGRNGRDVLRMMAVVEGIYMYNCWLYLCLQSLSSIEVIDKSHAKTFKTPSTVILNHINSKSIEGNTQQEKK